MEFYATLGDPCARRDILDKLFRAGMTGIRVNLSHTSLDKCAPLLEGLYWPAARQAGREDAHLILDLQGPELRVGELPRPILLREGDEVLLGDGGIPVPQGILQTARRGQQISIDDGALLLEVKRSSPTVLLCRVVRGGPLLSRKSLSIRAGSLLVQNARTLHRAISASEANLYPVMSPAHRAENCAPFLACLARWISARSSRSAAPLAIPTDAERGVGFIADGNSVRRVGLPDVVVVHKAHPHIIAVPIQAAQQGLFLIRKLQRAYPPVKVLRRFPADHDVPRRGPRKNRAVCADCKEVFRFGQHFAEFHNRSIAHS